MSVPDEAMVAKLAANMGDRSVSVQSFEERFPGVFIRKKKKRDMSRTLSGVSMDSWVSDVESEESMSWLNNVGSLSPPSSPKPGTPGKPPGRMLPVMSMDRLDEANVSSLSDPVRSK